MKMASLCAMQDSLCRSRLPSSAAPPAFRTNGAATSVRFVSLSSAERCPVNHKRWAKGGCVTTLATSAGARLRYQIDRSCTLYKRIYNQRTATERIFSQAVALGIQHPKLRNGQAIAHQNTLIYVLLNLRTLLRVLEKQAGQ